MIQRITYISVLLLLSACLGTRAQQRDTIVVVHRDTVWYMPDAGRASVRKDGWFKSEKALRRPVAAVRTNLLLPLLNAGAEFPLSNRWSIGGDVFFPWAPRKLVDTWSPSRSHCFQGLGGLLEGRLWLGAMHRKDAGLEKYRLLGHSVALVAGGAYYDVQLDWKGRQGELYAAGIDYMYAMPLGKSCWGHLEFDLAVGFAYHVQHPYQVYSEGGYLIREKDGNGMPVRRIAGMLWGLPMKAGVTLVIPFRTSLPLRSGEGARR